MIKLYKFRPLETDNDYYRLKSILETGHFWCSNFNEQNDPMEWVFLSSGDSESIKQVFSEKMKYKICSFSGTVGFKNPAMWCYYANSFKWVAIEIEVDESNVDKIIYTDEITENWDAREILKRKSKARKQEDEFRYFRESDKNLHKIGNITAIYFWDPYHKISNRRDVTESNKNIKKYEELRSKIIKWLENNHQDNMSVEKFKVFVNRGSIESKEI